MDFGQVAHVKVNKLRELASVFVVAGLGAWIGPLIGLPLPYLTGPSILAALVAPTGWLSVPPNWLRQCCFVLIGIGMGAGVTPEAIALARNWPLPLLVMGGFLVVLVLSSAFVLQRFFGFERYGARLAATPGHLSFVIAMADTIGADVLRVSVLQAFRLLSLTILVPFVVLAVIDAGPDMLDLPQGTPMGYGALAVLVALSAALGWVVLKLRLPAPLLLAGMITSAVAHGAGIVEGIMPSSIAVPVFALMGTLIGSRFVGIKLAVLWQTSFASLTLTTIALGLTFLTAELVHWLTGLPRLDLLIAFAPGGIETMAALSLMLGADPALVAVHHVVRLLYLSVLIPILMPRPPS